jgi:hypothetical protein
MKMSHKNNQSVSVLFPKNLASNVLEDQVHHHGLKTFQPIFILICGESGESVVVMSYTKSRKKK